MLEETWHASYPMSLMCLGITANNCISTKIRLRDPSELAIERQLGGGVSPNSARAGACVFYPLQYVCIWEGSLAIISLLDSSDFLTPQKSGSQIPIHRSRSVPTLNTDGSTRQIDSFSALFRVVPTTPRVAEGKIATLTTAPTKDAVEKCSNSKAVFRLRIRSCVSDGNGDSGEDIREDEAVCRMFLFSSLSVEKMGSDAIAISLPFSCILGLLASMTSTTIVRRKFACLYATVQFALVAVLSVLIATIAGFGGAMSGTSLLFKFLKLRGRWNARSNQYQAARELETAHTTQVDAQPESETGDSRTQHVG
ncbi:RING/U-box superfamily protein [Actinidia rufa]|uniref:RING/U-box superfamily protein n=1 Tax=Actinidia rufa TaxID=165716 RepID=A0A7J0F3S0_9ERIC|nr:RING/U-box superfamily protein [Actinidia rufa]